MDLKKVIIMTDLDGTLLNDEKRVSEKDLEAVARFRADGGHFTVATGRGVAMAKSVVDTLRVDMPCVIFNGAAVYDFKNDKFLWHSSMPAFAVEYIKKLMAEFHDIGIEILRGEEVFVVNNNETVDEHMAIESIVPIYADIDNVPKDNWLKVLIAYPPQKLDKVVEFVKNDCRDGVNWVRSAPVYYEMLPQGISKGYGYKKLLEVTGKTDLFTVAAGDFGNDYDMIRSADLGVAVGNAQNEIKEAAKLIVGDNNSSPMAEIIEYVRKL